MIDKKKENPGRSYCVADTIFSIQGFRPYLITSTLLRPTIPFMYSKYSQVLRELSLSGSCTKDRQWSLRDGYFFILLVTHRFSRLRSSDHAFLWWISKIDQEHDDMLYEPIIQTKPTIDEQAQLDEMARESLFALNRENGMSEEEAKELEASTFESMQESVSANDLDTEAQKLQDTFAGMSESEAQELAQMGDIYPKSDNPDFVGIKQDTGDLVQQDPDVDLTDRIHAGIKPPSEFSNGSDQDVPGIDPMDPNSPTNNYHNLFARLIGGMAQIVGPDTELGSRLSDFADELEGSDADAEQFRSDIDPDYYDLNKLNGSGSKTDAHDTVPFVEKGQDPKSDRENITEPESELRAHITKENDKTMSDLARKDVISKTFLTAGKTGDLGGMPDMMSSMKKELFDDTLDQSVGVDAWEDGSPQKQHCADTHMGMMRGLETYGRTARECIQETYSDDPEKMHQAMTGLERTMGALVPQAYDAVYQDNKCFDFLSDKDRQELDAMHFDGVDVKYSEFAAKKDGLDKHDDLAMYGNAGLDDPLESDKTGGPESGLDKKGADKPSGSKSKPGPITDRRADAEREFASQLAKFKEQQSGLSMSL